MSTASRQWQRFSPAVRLGRFAVYLVSVAAIAWSLKTIEVIPEFLYDAPEQTADLFRRMWPFDWPFWGEAVRDALIETFHIATLGTVLALAMAIPLSFLAARNFTRHAGLNWLAQFVFVSSRSVNSLIWALLFVAIFGPGALAGVLSIAFRSIGFVGKLFCEALEEAQAGPIEALTAAGAPRSMVLAKAYWPQVEPAFWSLALLRWDINIRESAVLGLVGAGGIGLQLNASVSRLAWPEVTVMFVAILCTVAVSEWVSARVRAAII